MNAREKRLRAAALFAGMVLLSSLFAVQGALLTDVIREFSLTDSMQGLYTSAASAGGIASFIGALILMRRVRKTVLLFLGALIASGGLFLVSLMPVFPAFLAVWFLIGIGMGLEDTLLSSCMADLYSGQTGSRMMCMLHMTYGIASMITPLVCTGLVDSGFGFRGAYRGVAAVGIPVLVIMYLAFFKNGQGTVNDRRPQSGESFFGLFALLKEGSLGMFTAAMLMNGFFLGGLNNWLNHFIGNTLGSDLGSLGLTFMYLGVLISRLLFPLTGIRETAFVRFSGFASAAVFALAVLTGNAVCAVAGAAISGLMFGALIPCMLSLACADLPENTGLATTWMMLALYLGEAAGSPVMGIMESGTGLDKGMLLCCVFMVLTSLCCSGAVRRLKCENR